MKKVSTREFFNSPKTVESLRPGEELAVTDNGEPSFTVTKAGKRPRRTMAEIDKRSRAIFKGKRKLNLTKAVIEIR